MFSQGPGVEKKSVYVPRSFKPSIPSPSPASLVHLMIFPDSRQIDLLFLLSSHPVPTTQDFPVNHVSSLVGAKHMRRLFDTITIIHFSN